VIRARDRAAGFLLAQQRLDGAWRDFHLARGVSTSWVTAYVGLRLAPLAATRPEIELALAAAARFLRRHREAEGGWGYNRQCRTDADSTANALLFLATRPEPVDPADVAALAKFQRPEGGFATYRHLDPARPWSQPSAEVTPAALRALSRFLAPDHAILARARVWLEQTIAQTDWRPYWWTTPHYLRAELAHFGMRLTAPPPDGVFAEALALEADLRLGLAPGSLAGLLERQAADGGWPSAPILRAPGPHIAPGSEEVESAPAYADQDRIFTTATVLGALNLAAQKTA
jgi:Prenyltransferase and squalene oxidase repeat